MDNLQTATELAKLVIQNSEDFDANEASATQLVLFIEIVKISLDEIQLGKKSTMFSKFASKDSPLNQ